MESKYIDVLFGLLEKAENENDSDTVVALKWAIFSLENQYGGN